MIKTKTKKCNLCKERITYNEESFPDVCPACGEKYWEKPLVEIKLHRLQDKYIATRDQKYLGEMFVEMKEIATNIIYGHLKSNGKYLNQEDVEDKALETMEKIIRSYLKSDQFYIKNSFTGYIQQAALYPLYNDKLKRTEQNEVSVNTPIGGGFDGNKERTILDKLSSQSKEGVQEEYLNNILEEELLVQILDFVSIFANVAFREKGAKEALTQLVLLKHFIQHKPDRFFDRCWEFYPYDTRNHFDKLTINLKRFMEEALQEG